MLTKAPILSKLIFITVLALLFLTLFDSNPWWKVVLYALPATALNVFLLGVLGQRGLPPYLSAALQGLTGAAGLPIWPDTLVPHHSRHLSGLRSPVQPGRTPPG